MPLPPVATGFLAGTLLGSSISVGYIIYKHKEELKQALEQVRDDVELKFLEFSDNIRKGREQRLQKTSDRSEGPPSGPEKENELFEGFASAVDGDFESQTTIRRRHVVENGKEDGKEEENETETYSDPADIILDPFKDAFAVPEVSETPEFGKGSQEPKTATESFKSAAQSTSSTSSVSSGKRSFFVIRGRNSDSSAADKPFFASVDDMGEQSSSDSDFERISESEIVGMGKETESRTLKQ